MAQFFWGAKTPSYYGSILASLVGGTNPDLQLVQTAATYERKCRTK